MPTFVSVSSRRCPKSPKRATVRLARRVRARFSIYTVLMASVAQDKRPSIVLTVLMLAVTFVVGIVLLQWVTGLIFGLIRLAVILVGFYLIARLGLYLLRKGR